MSAQLQRYFAATAGGAIGVTWMTAGIGTALFTLATATCSYGAVVFHQRRRPVRRTRPVVRAARRRVPPARPEGLRCAELELDSQPSATGSYGW
jgi:hypothetical protein